MRGVVRSTQIILLGFVSLTVACGGGGGAGGVQSPLPQPDFTLAFSATSISLPQGGTSLPVNVSINPTNGFSTSVQVSFTGLPDGVTTSPAGSFSLAPGQNASVLFGASPTATAGQFSVTAQSTSGALSHSQNISLAVQTVAPTNLSRSTYVGNDSVASLDRPQGEPRRRQIVFDSANQRFYVANCAMNRVEVFSSVNPTLQAAIDAPGASSVDLSADGSTLWVGTTLEQTLAVSTSTLQVKARYPVAGLTPIPGLVFIRPSEVLALSGGNLLVRLRQANISQSLLALWDSASNTFTNLTPLAPAVFQNGVGVLARSRDHTRVLAAANDSSGELVVFDGSGNLLAGPQAPVSGVISAAAAISTAAVLRSPMYKATESRFFCSMPA